MCHRSRQDATSSRIRQINRCRQKTSTLQMGHKTIQRQINDSQHFCHDNMPRSSGDPKHSAGVRAKDIALRRFLHPPRSVACGVKKDAGESQTALASIKRYQALEPQNPCYWGLSARHWRPQRDPRYVVQFLDRMSAMGRRCTPPYLQVFRRHPASPRATS